ncbi:MAG: response regulator transcription factor [Candidatus Sulfotelmatobacter sp.]
MPRILIVDDNPTIRHCVRRCIEANTDWRVCDEAENGQVAVEKVMQHGPEMVILDFQMPVMNGLEAARQITRIAPQTVMVMFTMHQSAHLVDAAKAAGITEVIPKDGNITEHLLAILQGISAGS